MLLPPRSVGQPIELSADVKQITIIGANGGGKTRFTDYLEASLGDNAFHISALEALCGITSGVATHNSIATLYERAVKSSAFLHTDVSNMFEQLTMLLLNEEMSNLVAYKMELAQGKRVHMAESKLDEVIRRWQEVFPDNHVMRAGGGLLFSRTGDADTYSQFKLSHGEKTVLFYFGAVLYAPSGATIFVDNPGIFLHNSLLHRLWNTIEGMRPDCRFVYTTHDVDFAASRGENAIVWVRAFDPDRKCWDYDLLPPDSGLSDEIYMALVGTRRPVLFIEGDATHSIDAKLYPLVFQDFSIKSLGSCNKVIEATRAFNDLRAFHHLESCGIVDRDRRDEREVDYLRSKNIFVPNVAEIENILMLEDVVKAVANFHHKNPSRVFAAVKKSILSQFRTELHQQALLHTRHRVKRTMEYRVDGRFTNIGALEEHMQNLIYEINPRGIYDSTCKAFNRFADEADYASILCVYNQKLMIQRSNVAQLCGFTGGKEAYVQAVISVLKSDGPDAQSIRAAVIKCFGLDGK